MRQQEVFQEMNLHYIQANNLCVVLKNDFVLTAKQPQIILLLLAVNENMCKQH